LSAQDPIERSSNRRSSERRQTEEPLRQSEERLIFALEAGHLGLWEFDLQDHTVYRSPEHDRIFGYESMLPEWTYDMFLDHVVPEDRALVDEKFRAAVAAHGNWDFECRIRRADGEIRWVWATGSHRPSDSGPQRMAGLMEDITERKQVEVSLEKTRKELAATKLAEDAAREYAESIINTVREPVIALDQDLRVVTVSRSFQEFFQVDPVETKGKLIYDLGNKQWDIPKLRELLETLLPQGTSYDGYKVEHDFAAIGPRTMLLNARQIEPSPGQERLILLAIEDITERTQAQGALRESEESLRDLFDTMTSGCAIYEVRGDGSSGSDYIVKDFNASSLAMEGKTKEEVIGKSLLEIRPAIDEYGLVPVLQKVWQTGEPATFPSHMYVDENFTNWYENRVFKLPSGEVAAIYDDVTERKEAEKQLLLIGKAVGSAGDAIGISDAQGHHIYQNQATADLFEYATAEEMEAAGGGVATVKDPEVVKEMFGNLMSGKPWSGELEMVTKSGRVFPAYERADAITDSEGNVVGLIGIVSDITERKQLEESLYRTQFAVDHSSDFVHWFDPEGRCLYVNDSSCRRLGYSREELLGMTIYDIDPGAPRPWPSHFQEVKEGGSFTFESSLRTKHGEFIPVDVTVNYVNFGGQEYNCATSRDITERKQAEEELRESDIRFRELFNRMSSGVAVYEAIDNGGDFIFSDCNPAVERIEKVSRKDILGRPVSEAFPGVKAFGVLEVFQRVWQTGNPEYHPESLYKDEINPGSWRETWVFKLPSGEIVAIYNDISERKETEEKLARSKVLLSETEKTGRIGGWAFDVGTLTQTWTEETFRILEIDSTKGEPKVPEGLGFVAPASRQMAEQAVQRAIEYGEPYDQDWEIVTALGNRRWVHAVAKTHQEQGKTKSISGSFQDITERKQAEEALRESQKRFQALTETTSDFVWEMDANGVYTYCSPQIAELWGYRPEDMIGRSPFDLMPPEDKEHAVEMFRTLSESPRSFKAMETGSWDSGGRPTVLETSGVPFFDTNGGLCGYRGVSRDITERRQAEDELAQSHDLLANLARLVPGVIYQYRLYPDGRSAFPYSSPGISDIYEVTPEEVREDATPVFGRLHPDDYDYVADAIAESARTLETFYCEFRVVLPRQGLRWRWSQAEPMRTEDGGTLWHGIISDITERKELEAQREASRAFYEGILQSTREGVWVTDADDRIIFWNHGMAAIAGAEAEAVHGLSVVGEFPAETTDRFLVFYLRAKEDLEPVAYEAEVLTPAGRHTVQSGWLVPRVRSGKFDGMICTIIDITERKQAEAALRASQERYRALVDLSPDAILVDVDGKYVFANAAAARLFGADSPEELIGKVVTERIHPDCRALVARRAAQVSAGAATSPAEIQLLRLDGTSVAAEVAASPIEFEGRRANQVVYRDITERMRLEESLRLTQLSVDAALDMIDWIDSDGRLVYMNDAYCRRLGYSREELLGMSVFDIDPRTSPETWPQQWRQDKERGSKPFEVVHRTKAGETFPVEIVSYFFEQYGKEYHVGVERDITERKEAEQALKLTRFSVDHAGDGIVWVDHQGRLVDVNNSFSAQTGYSREELLSMTVFDVTVGLRPDDWSARWLELKEHGSGIFEKQYRAKDGRIYPVEISSTIIEHEGREYNSGIVRDITERKRLERALRLKNLVFDESLSANSIADLDGVITEANDAFVRVWGYPGKEAVIGQPIDHFLDDPTEAAAIVAALHADGRWEGEYVARRGNGSTFTAHGLATAVRDAEGTMMGYQSAVSDITSRKEAEAALRTSEAQLRQSQKMEAVGQLAGGIAHDFNNLLTAILGYSDMILASGTSTVDEVRPDIEEIKHAGERASALTQQILAFSRRQTLRPAALSLNEVLEGMDSLLRRTLGENIDLVTQKDPHLDLTEVDPHQFEQVLMNLVLNARDAMSSGGRLTLVTGNVQLDEQYCKAHPEVAPGPHVMLSVSDTGVGMDPEIIIHIFEPFFTTKAFGEGTGLGLAVIHGIVTQSHGSISVESEPGEGTTFQIYLPRATPSHIPEEIVVPARVSARGHETVVVVEDEAALRSLIERILDGAGYTTLSFGSSDEALAAFGQGECSADMLLTDVMLPGALQGHDLARTVRAARPDLPVLYISGYSRDALVHAGRLDEGVNLLEKPFTPETLATMVRTVLDQSRIPG
jgi:two-component system cell cycle sensor histidine kinase/response regulator CckA